jgi:EAL domain-containing protein (putative c-di-GMP-specific phosphodiesterase class I)
VETQAQRDFLIESGCRIGQGDLFGAAGSAADLESLLRARLAA